MQDDVDYIDYINYNDNDDREFKISDDQSQSYDFRDRDFCRFDNLRIIECMMIVFLTIVVDISMKAFSFISFFNYAFEVISILTDF